MCVSFITCMSLRMIYERLANKSNKYSLTWTSCLKSARLRASLQTEFESCSRASFLVIYE